MSRLEELIQEYCPNGSRFVGIGDIGECVSGATPKTSAPEFWMMGTIPWMSSGEVNKSIIIDTEVKITQKGYDSCSTKLVPPNTVVIALAGQGKTRGNVAITRIELCTNQSLCSIVVGDRILPDFLYHYLKGQYMKLREISSGDGTRGGLNLKMIRNFQIPLPPLPVQEEIVRILDTFTALEAELKAELEARKKQYEYYREAMFICSKCQYYRVMDLTIDRYWLMPATPNFITEKGIPYITSKNVKKGNIDFGNVKYITEEDYQNVSRNREIQPNDVIIGMIGTLGEMAIVQPHDLPFYGQNMYLLRLNFQKINLRYFYHYFDTKQMKEYFQRVKNASSQGYLKANHIEDLSIPLPPLAEQERIVSILDRFDSLVNDITQGLPAEIEARRKQYEYYRNQLLTFKEATL
jgi:type I restriction enzyme S subunit